MHSLLHNLFKSTALIAALWTTSAVAQIVDVSPPGTPQGSVTVDVGALVPPVFGDFYDSPALTNNSQQISIPETFAPFGSRPVTDKSSEDGSVAIRDLNGVIIWIDNRNRAVTIPDSSLAKTLYVSNTECIVWTNRFDLDYDQVGSSSEVVIHRRLGNGTVVSSEPIIIEGTLLETASISPGSFSFTLVAVEKIETEPVTESREIRARNNEGFITNITPVDQWDRQVLTMYRVTFDAQIQKLDSIAYLISKAGGNLGSTFARSTSADGAVYIDMRIAGTTLVDLTAGEFFFTIPFGLWVTWEANAETFTPIPTLFSDFTSVASQPIFVTNNRLIIQERNFGTVQDFRKQGQSAATIVGSYPFSGQILDLTTFTKPGFTPYFYVSTGTGLRLYTLNNGVVPIGAAVPTPPSATLSSTTPFVRNPRDASLLIRTQDNTGTLWFRTILDPVTQEPLGLEDPQVIPSSSQSIPMFVNADEAVVWMNGEAPPDPGGVVPLADLAHFHVDGFALSRMNLSPPILGRFVASPSSLVPDPSTEGWFISTFERVAPRVATLRTYRLELPGFVDSDGDGLPDWLEFALGTDPFNPDTDGDGIIDGLEVFPYYLVPGEFTYEEAVADARARGGWLAVIDTELKDLVIRRLLGNLPLGESYWLGGKGFIDPIPGNPNNRDYRWLFDSEGNSVMDPVVFENWAPGQPTTFNGADQIVLRSNYQWETQPLTNRNGYIMQFYTSNPLRMDTDGDGVSDFNEVLNGTHPAIPNVFSGVPNLPVPGGLIAFNDPAISTNYEGLVFQPGVGHIGNITLRLNRNGRFSYRFTGLIRGQRANGRGEFNPAGGYFGNAPRGLSDALTVEMQLVEQLPGEWAVLGRMNRVNGQTLGFEMRTQKYGRNNPYPTPGNLTMAMPKIGASIVAPNGEGAATGQVNRNGQLNLRMHLPDGGRASFRGSILNGDYVALTSVSNSTNRTAVVGPIDVAPANMDRDYGGTLRLYAPGGHNSNLPGGVEQLLNVLGSNYVPPSRGFLPISTLIPTAFNSQFRFIGGEFGGINKIGTWATNNRITVPFTPNDRARPRFAARTGLMQIRYQLTDPELELIQTTANGFAVVLQRPQQIRGFYNTQFSDGVFHVVPNDGTLPEITRINPRNKSVAAGPTEYVVQVDTPGAWRIRLPGGPLWIRAEVVDGAVIPPPDDDDDDNGDNGDNGEPVVPQDPLDPDNPLLPGPEPDEPILEGFGRGTVRVTVGQNSTGMPRNVTIEIAGVPHKINQDFR